MTGDDDALPTLLVIGAMKCGTTALHHLLDQHPQIRMSRPKELNFFIGPHAPPPRGATWTQGNWWRGLDWYTARLPQGTTARGESSPGYTSPDHPEAPGRIAALVPDARLIYLVRDPIDRAVSQYRHHRADGTEARPMAEALLDPASQYIARSRYHERLAPYLARFPLTQILVVAQEDLRDALVPTLHRVFSHLGLETSHASHASATRTGAGSAPLARDLRERLTALLADDAAALRDLLGAPLAQWSL